MEGLILTQEELKNVLHYDEKTGIFTWLKCHKTSLIGSIAGHLNSDGYVVIGVMGKKYAAHRLAYLYAFGNFPSFQIDHIDHDKKNNSIINLRDVSASENQRNSSLNKKNTSGFTGVFFNKKENRFRSQVRIGGKVKHLGSFLIIEDAIAARASANANHNFHKNHGAKNG